MVRDLDATLIETVRVRRRRLRDAFVYGRLRTRRVGTDNLRPLLIGVVIAGIVCAICAGVSFVRANISHSAAPPPGVTAGYAPAGRAA